MAHPLRDRMKQQGQTSDPLPQESPRIALAEKKVNGWTVRVMGKNVGTLTDPQGRTVAVNYDQGIATTFDALPVYNHEAGEILYAMLRGR